MVQQVLSVSQEPRERVRRRLAAVLVAGYTRLFPGDEVDGLAGLRAFLTEIIEPRIAEFGGQMINWTGERALIEFDSAVEATRYAALLRDAASKRNQMLLPEQRIAFRIGINLGDIVLESGDIFGDGVNIAARLEALAEPGSIYVSENVYEQIAGKVASDFIELGPKNLKNIARPIRVYQMTGKKSEVGCPGAAIISPPGFDDRRAIAVLPFANFSGDPEQEYFADGITEDIIALLAGWRAFPVIPRHSTFTSKGKTIDIKKAGAELGVPYVLDGGVPKPHNLPPSPGHAIQSTPPLHIQPEN